MDKAERANLIRERHRAKAGGLAYAPSGRPAKAKPARPVVDRLVIGWPQIIPDTKRAPGWMKERAENPKLIPMPDRRRKGDSALTRIAAKWRKTLVRLESSKQRINFCR